MVRRSFSLATLERLRRLPSEVVLAEFGALLTAIVASRAGTLRVGATAGREDRQT